MGNGVHEETFVFTPRSGCGNAALCLGRSNISFFLPVREHAVKEDLKVLYRRKLEDAGTRHRSRSYKTRTVNFNHHRSPPVSIFCPPVSVSISMMT